MTPVTDLRWKLLGAKGDRPGKDSARETKRRQRSGLGGRNELCLFLPEDGLWIWGRWMSVDERRGTDSPALRTHCIVRGSFAHRDDATPPLRRRCGI